MEDEWQQQQQQPHHDENNMVTDEQAFSYEGYTEGQEYNNDNNENELENDDDDDDILEMHDGGDSWKEAEGVLLMKFCPHDSSMLYPREHKRTRTLRYACRLCRYSEESPNPLIYRNVLKKEVGNVLHTVPGSVSDDPTLPRSHNSNCESCGHNEAVFFQSDTGQSDSLALIFVCSNCGHKWVA